MSTGKILLVEDDQNDIMLMERALEKVDLPLELIIARDGKEALEYLRNESNDGQEKLPSIIILDLNMPRMSWLEFLKILNQDSKLRRIPIVILSSSIETRDICESYDLGANSYIQKPVEFEKFVDVLRMLGLYWITLNISTERGITCDRQS